MAYTQCKLRYIVDSQLKLPNLCFKPKLYNYTYVTIPTTAKIERAEPNQCCDSGYHIAYIFVLWLGLKRRGVIYPWSIISLWFIQNVRLLDLWLYLSECFKYVSTDLRHRSTYRLLQVKCCCWYGVRYCWLRQKAFNHYRLLQIEECLTLYI